MRCSKAARYLQLYMDKRLGFEQMRKLEAHLSFCLSCRENLFLLETIEQSLQSIELIVEPAELTENIMRQVALNARQTRATEKPTRNFAFRPSLSEILAAVLLATFATLGMILEQPSLRAILPIANGHDALSIAVINTWRTLIISMNSGTLMLVFWIIGTFLGVWITLVLAGAEMRTRWFRAVIGRLPVW